MTVSSRDMFTLKFLIICSQYMRISRLCTNSPTGVLRAQYKSRNCMGDVDTYRSELGYKVLIRNVYETSHGKGPHDAAGGFLKSQADFAVLRGKTKIKSANELYNFAHGNLQNLRSGIYKRRIFKYIEEIPRLQNKKMNPVSQNRKNHQIISSNSDDLLVRDVSCYNCDDCYIGKIQSCEKLEFIGNHRTAKMVETSCEKNDEL